jgi:hypothetical protein
MISQGEERTPATDTAEESSPLLRLPAELRNDIYRLVVVSPNAIRVGVTGFSEPPILSVSKQIRRETSVILYAENNFDVDIYNYDITSCQKWNEKLRAAHWRHELHTCNGFHGSFVHATTPNWANLLAWMKLNHAGLTRLSVWTRPAFDGYKRN